MLQRRVPGVHLDGHAELLHLPPSLPQHQLRVLEHLQHGQHLQRVGHAVALGDELPLLRRCVRGVHLDGDAELLQRPSHMLQPQLRGLERLQCRRVRRDGHPVALRDELHPFGLFVPGVHLDGDAELQQAYCHLPRHLFRLVSVVHQRLQ